MLNLQWCPFFARNSMLSDHGIKCPTFYPLTHSGLRNHWNMDGPAIGAHRTKPRLTFSCHRQEHVFPSMPLCSFLLKIASDMYESISCNGNLWLRKSKIIRFFIHLFIWKLFYVLNFQQRFRSQLLLPCDPFTDQDRQWILDGFRFIILTCGSQVTHMDISFSIARHEVYYQEPSGLSSTFPEMADITPALE